MNGLMVGLLAMNGSVQGRNVKEARCGTEAPSVCFIRQAAWGQTNHLIVGAPSKNTLGVDSELFPNIVKK